MLAATAAAKLLDLQDHGVRLVGDIPAGIPTPGFPDVTGSDLMAMLGPALGIAFVGYTDNILTGRGFAARHHETVEPQRELVALGAANVGAGLMGGMPVSSSGSRTAIGDAVGQKTQLAGLVTVVCVVLALLTLRPPPRRVPVGWPRGRGRVRRHAARRPEELARFSRFRRSELALALATTLSVLVFDVLYGILVAIALSVLDLLRRVARPHDAVLGIVPGMAGMHDVEDYPSAEVIPGLLVYRYDSPLFFANAEDFRERALRSVDEASEPVRWFLLNAEANVDLDVTGADALEQLRAELERRGIVFAMARVKEELGSNSPGRRCSPTSARTGSSRPCPPRSTRTVPGRRPRRNPPRPSRHPRA